MKNKKCQYSDSYFLPSPHFVGDRRTSQKGRSMTDLNYTHITFVVDRSGSMQSSREYANRGINLTLAEQFAEPGKLTVTLVDFDSEFQIVHRMSDKPFEYGIAPRGNTALFDAIGTEILNTGKDLAELPENERPGKVIFVITTDGLENASREFTLDAVREMVSTQTEQFNWNFQFIGPDMAAWQGEGLGMKTSRTRGTNKSMSSSMYSFNAALKEMRSDPLKTSFEMDAMIDDDLDFFKD